MSTPSASCPHCQAKLKLKNAGLVGKKVRCPRCNKPFTLQLAGSDEDVLDIQEAEEVASDAGEEDWLAALDSLDAPAPAASKRSTPQAPPVVGKRKKKVSGKEQTRSRFRDEDGEMPLWLHRLLMIGTGVLGGLIGTALWAFLIYVTEWQSSYVALFVGAFVGAGVRLGASKWDYGWGPAITGSIIAFLAIIAGKIIGMHLLLAGVEREMAEFARAYAQLAKHENFQIQMIAFEILYEDLDTGEEGPGVGDETSDVADELPIPATAWMPWMEDEEFDAYHCPTPEELPEQFPPNVWSEAKQRWDQLPADEKQKRQAAADAAVAQGDWEDELDFGRPSILHPLDLLFAVFAIIAAFRISAGWTDD